MMEGEDREDIKEEFVRHYSSSDSDGSSEEEDTVERGKSEDENRYNTIAQDDSRGRPDVVATSPSTRSSSGSSTRLKKYFCGDCDKSYSRPSLLQQHIRTHTGEKPFQCSSCEESFTRKDHLTRHNLKHLHGIEKPFHCSVCGKGCNTMQHLKRHEKVHEKSFSCEHCHESFFKHQTLKHHISTVHFPDRLMCTDCNKVFKRPYRLENHKLKAHGESPGYQCTYPGCFKNYKTWSALTLHVKCDHPKLVCKICNKGCIGAIGLEMHMKIHDNHNLIKLWNCKECGAAFLKKNLLIKHYDDSHSDLEIPHDLLFNSNTEEKNNQVELDDPLTPRSIEITPPSLINTDTIDKTKIKKINGQSLSSCLTQESAINLISENVSQRTIPCIYKNCSRLFKKQYDLNRHLKWHDKMKVHLAKKIEKLKDEMKSEESMGNLKVGEKQ
ncbi:hypothetical protein PACTADRAFT_52111 [Pachysolen tannophilus NRRL Y-2460]|uniref:pH-response transcription factor pacC/RIM101 n=1 Tax=Pachysolen tannophilus NRRL Y-2460 TaxID=669874 RepID=A0A1E4TP56_PACTA|nr:hypothetical protein PACTADRAFT_52111 [Pachysolen tannophilus NRRL Y-2460]